MLVRLRVENVALAERIELDVGPGLTVLTGETGAGKSLVVDALSLLHGGRGAVDFIRTGANAAVIEATFRTEDPAIAALLEEHGIMLESGEVVFRRVLNREGRHRSFLNGAQVPATQAAEIAALLLDIHGQFEQQSLLKPAEHLHLLDSAAGLSAKVAEYAALYATWRALEAEEANLRAQTQERARRLDFLRFQLEEIDRIAPRPNEVDELEAERRRLDNADRLALICAEAETILYDGDEAVAVMLKGLARKLDDALRYDEAFEPWAKEVDELAIRAEELSRSIGGHARHFEADPARLSAIHERLDELTHLRRKYGDLADLEAQAKDMRAELAALEISDDRLNALVPQRTELEKTVRALAAKLHSARKAAAGAFAKRIEKALRPLGMAEASLEWRILPEDEPGPSGADRVELLLSANRGEPTRPLQKVASGGELSRVMLALHTAALEAGGPACVIFDEVDAGIGGEVGEAIGKALRQVAERAQVICVTHLPQIAVFAHQHWTVKKRIAGERTVSEIFKPDADARLAEIGRMLGGAADGISREHAKALLERASG
jgi:DNA repair protein RecN (Recombination protein N)